MHQTHSIPYLLKRDTIVLKKEEAIFPDGSLDLLNKAIDNSGVIRVK